MRKYKILPVLVLMLTFCFLSTSVFCDDKIDINKAGINELCSLPGIGKKTAKKIIDYRTKIGPFKSIEEITNVKGIGRKKSQKLKDKITVGEVVETDVNKTSDEKK